MMPRVVNGVQVPRRWCGGPGRRSTDIQNVARLAKPAGNLVDVGFQYRDRIMRNEPVHHPFCVTPGMRLIGCDDVEQTQFVLTDMAAEDGIQPYVAPHVQAEGPECKIEGFA